MLLIRERKEGVTLECRITPRARRDEIRGERDGALLIALTAPPLEGRANDALIRLLAKTVSIPASSIQVLTGEHNRNKVLLFQGISEPFLRKALQHFIAPQPARP